MNNDIQQVFLFNDLYIKGGFILIILYSLYVMSQGLKKSNWVAIILLIALTIFWGNFPYLNDGGDRYNYIYDFNEIKQYGSSFNLGYDKIWSYYTFLCSRFMSVSAWLLLTAFIYVFSHYYFSRKVIGIKDAGTMMVMFLGFVFFNSYAINTMRAGLAMCCLLIALANYNKKIVFYGMLAVSTGFHFSMIIPVLSIVACRFYGNSRFYFFIWLLSIPLSYVMGSTFSSFFSTLSSDTRTSYLTTTTQETLYKIGFRLDFIVYSCIPIILGYYYIFKRKINDKFYKMLFNAYLATNAFWILVIRSNFSDRFAYLSWFMLPILLIFPPLKYNLWKKQNVKVALILFFHGLFTFILSIR